MDENEINRHLLMALDRGYARGLKDGGGDPAEVRKMREETALYRDLRQAISQSFSLSDFLAVKRTWEIMYSNGDE